MGTPVEGVRFTRASGVLRIELDRPGAKNAMSQSMIAAILDELDGVADDLDIRAILLTTGNENFCTGMDLAESNKTRAERPRVGNHQRRIADGPHRLIRTLAETQLPVVAAVRGWAGGIGLGITLCADFIVADRSAKFWAPYVARGFSPDSGTTYLLPRVVGLNRAKQILMLGKPFDADRAKEWGMLTEVTSSDEWAATADDIATTLATSATVAVGIARNLLHRNLDTDLASALRNEEFAEEVSLRSSDFKEGLASLRERRPSEFSGR
jgi:2-(1,2-epoxy-1,2-dihydrophenyl)acetyl-CoA isomerase